MAFSGKKRLTVLAESTRQLSLITYCRDFSVSNGNSQQSEANCSNLTFAIPRRQREEAAKKGLTEIWEVSELSAWLSIFEHFPPDRWWHLHNLKKHKIACCIFYCTVRWLGISSRTSARICQECEQRFTKTSSEIWQQLSRVVLQ